ncbi:MAG: hypothetical protein ACJAW8_001446 [Oleispira sp.]|jgi:hypothetical protein|tara:strand:+ start:425 stop:877 length:453 start_codon:yes stop_codon:yes gene_type:complete
MNTKSSVIVRTVFAKIFTVIFFGLAAAIILSLVVNVVEGIISGENIMQMFLSSINTGIIALAVFELALVIDKEYSGHEEESDAVVSLRRTIPRFIGTVCVALSLEGLIMVIKYSQLDLAGNLYYPVAIISSTALLLTSLSIFLYLTRDQA